MEAIWWFINVIGAGVLLILGVSWLSEKIDKHYEKEEQEKKEQEKKGHIHNFKALRPEGPWKGYEGMESFDTWDWEGLDEE